MLSRSTCRPLALFAALGAALLAGCGFIAPAEQPQAETSLERGGEVYQAYCIGCHGGAEGGSMMDWPPRHNANGHTWHHPDCQLVEIVLDGSGEMGEMMRRMMAPPDAPRMPAFRDQLSHSEVVAILDYIKTWWTDEQRDFQARITEAQC